MYCTDFISLLILFMAILCKSYSQHEMIKRRPFPTVVMYTLMKK